LPRPDLVALELQQRQQRLVVQQQQHKAKLEQDDVLLTNIARRYLRSDSGRADE
jgi:hypothetical protein